MKLGSLKSSSRDGQLIVVSRDNKYGIKATGIADSLREAVENWPECEPKLKSLYDQLNLGGLTEAFEIENEELDLSTTEICSVFYKKNQQNGEFCIKFPVKSNWNM